jgi:hypothetical protein
VLLPNLAAGMPFIMTAAEPCTILSGGPTHIKESYIVKAGNPHQKPFIQNPRNFRHKS